MVYQISKIHIKQPYSILSAEYRGLVIGATYYWSLITDPNDIAAIEAQVANWVLMNTNDSNETIGTIYTVTF